MSRQILPNYQQAGDYPDPEQDRQQYPSSLTGMSSYYGSHPPDAGSADGAAAGAGGLELAGSVPGGTPSTRPTYSKRGKITIVACVPCRKRKTKCDGHRPSCSQCTSRRQGCFYDMTDDQRKLTHLRENVEHLQEKSDSLQSLLHTIQTASEDEANEVFRRLRSGQHVQVVADHVQASHVLSGVSGSPLQAETQDTEAPVGDPLSPGDIGGRHLDFERLVSVLSLCDNDTTVEIVNRLKSREEISSILRSVIHTAPTFQLVQHAAKHGSPFSLENNFSRSDQAFGIVKGPEILATHAVQGSSSEFTVDQMRRPWTNVTSDAELVEHLIELYFTWQHSFFQSFPEKLFRTDMAAGRTKYCSAMLVNVVCACGCFLSDRAGVRQNCGDGKTLMDSFYEEAKDLLHRDESSNLTTVATLCLLSYIEGTKGKISSLWWHAGHSTLMATDINLHLQRSMTPGSVTLDQHERGNEHKARTHAFWGSFHTDATASFTLGRLPNYNVHGITVELPIVDQTEDEEVWSSREMELPHRPSARSSTFLHCASLSEIVNSSLLMFFAPTASLSGTLLMEHYEKYLEWKRNLPSNLSVTENSPPHVLSLHMYYHTAVLLLLRPFMKARIVNNPDVIPRDVCRQAANEISAVFAIHIRQFGLAGICMFQTHSLLTATTIHIVSLPTISATREFTTACNHFHTLVHRNEWARSSINILRGLVERWKLILPREAEEALYRKLPGEDKHERSAASDESLGLSATQPSFALPTDPASAYESNKPAGSASHMQVQQAALHDNLSNVDPALSQGQPPQKRQRTMMDNKHARHSDADESPVIGEPSEERQSQQSGPHQQHQRQPSAASYLYSPLIDQPAPFLVPVRSQRRSGAAASVQRRNVGPRSVLSSERTAAATSGIDAIVEGRSHSRSSADDGKTEQYPGVEGISFGEDWRDPFLGFLPVEEM